MTATQTVPGDATHKARPRFAVWVFRLAGLWGIAVIAPLFFMEAQMSASPEGPIARPEFFYGFAGVTLMFQFVFLTVSTDPVRFRPLMPVCVAEKLVGPMLIGLYLVGRGNLDFAMGGAIDILLGVLFAAAWLRTPRLG